MVVDRAEGVERAAWGELEELRGVVYRHLSFLCRDSSEADDLTQETLLRAARCRDRLADTQRLEAWMVRIAQNLFRDRRRRESRLHQVDDSGPWLENLADRRQEFGDGSRCFLIDGEWVELGDALHLLGRALVSLKLEDQQVLGEYYARDGGVDGVAERCHLPRRMVKVRTFRARRRLEREVIRQLQLCGTRLACGG